MTAPAVVAEISADGSVELDIAAGTACAGCAGVCLWRRLPDKHRTRLPAAVTLTQGARVLVCLPQRYVLMSAVLLHGLPWAALLLGAGVGAALAPGDAGTLAGAVIAVTFSIMMSPRLRRRLERATMERFVIQPL